jgi:hypothetical protein
LHSRQFCLDAISLFLKALLLRITFCFKCFSLLFELVVFPCLGVHDGVDFGFVLGDEARFSCCAFGICFLPLQSELLLFALAL